MSASVRDTIEQGNVARRSGRPVEALALYRQALAALPDDPEANSLCGLMEAQLGSAGEGERLLRRAVDRAPNQFPFRVNLAEFLLGQGRIAEAIPVMQTVVAMAPGYPRGWSRLGDMLLEVQRFGDAASSYGRASMLEPENLTVALKWAATLANVGQLADARRLLERLSRMGFGNAEYLGVYARVIEMQRDWRSLETVAGSWAKLSPQDQLAWEAWSRAAWETGRFLEGANRYRRAVELQPGDAGKLATYGRLCIGALDFDNAKNALDDAEAIAPDNIAMLSAKALLLTMNGQFTNAEAYCRRCLALDPDNVAALNVLNQLNPGRFSTTEMETLLRLSQSARPFEDRITAAFAYADALELEFGDDRAIKAYEAANAIGREFSRTENLSYLPSRRVAEIDALISWFPRAQPSPLADASPCPIFIIGMPRSGTTLVESVIASHPGVIALGERMAMRQIVSELFAQTVATPERLRAWADTYLAGIPLRPGANHFTDKNPWNFDAVGLILKLFPNAKIVHTRRNPIETGLSIFCNEFSKFSAFTNALGDIGHYYGQYARLMAHWEAVHGERIVTIQYEDFMAQFAQESRALLDRLGLGEPPKERPAIQTERPIATLSATQVRQGVRAAEDRAERYKAYIAPLTSALEAARVDLVTGKLRSE